MASDREMIAPQRREGHKGYAAYTILDFRFWILDFGLQIIAQGVLMRFDGTPLAECSREIGSPVARLLRLRRRGFPIGVRSESDGGIGVRAPRDAAPLHKHPGNDA